MKTEAEAGVLQPQAQECRSLRELREAQDSPLEPLRQQGLRVSSSFAVTHQVQPPRWRG